MGVGSGGLRPPFFGGGLERPCNSPAQSGAARRGAQGVRGPEVELEAAGLLEPRRCRESAQGAHVVSKDGHEGTPTFIYFQQLLPGPGKLKRHQS